jgi:hypothetical protein
MGAADGIVSPFRKLILACWCEHFGYAAAAAGGGVLSGAAAPA